MTKTDMSEFTRKITIVYTVQWTRNGNNWEAPTHLSEAEKYRGSLNLKVEAMVKEAGRRYKARNEDGSFKLDEHGNYVLTSGTPAEAIITSMKHNGKPYEGKLAAHDEEMMISEVLHKSYNT